MHFLNFEGLDCNSFLNFSILDTFVLKSQQMAGRNKSYCLKIYSETVVLSVYNIIMSLHSQIISSLKIITKADEVMLNLLGCFTESE